MSYLASEEKSPFRGEGAKDLPIRQAYSSARNPGTMVGGALFGYVLNPFDIALRTMRLVPEIILQFWRRQPNS